MAIPLFGQHADDELIYTWDFTRLLGSSVTISTATVTAEAGLTAGSASISSDNLKVTALISGGELYSQYLVTCQIVTSDGQTINRSLMVRIIQK